MVLSIGVFGSSASTTKAIYMEESLLLGKLIAEGGHICVNGAGKFGCMGGLNEGCISSNGQVKGVIHKVFLVDNGEDNRLKDLIVTEGNY
jgi:predicted Rossmann-fold nucleotide-binding protein